MSSKQKILQAIRQQPLVPVARPELAQAWTVYDDPLAQFTEVLAGVGGVCQPVADQEALATAIASGPEYSAARRVASRVGGVTGNVPLDTVDDPHQLADVDLAVLPAEFAVAENGAVWVSPATLADRAALFLAQHLALIVPAGQIVPNMHQAYDRLQFAEAGFGVFVSGPSKTADIEQSLVIGAHGPRSLVVYFVGQASRHGVSG